MRHVNFRFSEKATQIWRYLSQGFSYFIESKIQDHEGDCTKFLWPSQNIGTLMNEASRTQPQIKRKMQKWSLINKGSTEI